MRRLITNVFAEALLAIERNDQNYPDRYPLVLTALQQAAVLGLRCGIAIDPKEPDWPVVYIDLPTGQVSWHMPRYEPEWDGHTTAEKYARIHEFVKLTETLGYTPDPQCTVQSGSTVDTPE